MPFQPGAVLNTQAFGNRPESVEVPHIDVRAPASSDGVKQQFPVGKRWVDTLDGAEYCLTGYSSANGVTSATWALLGTDTGALNTLTGDSGGAISPSAGNINLLGTASQIDTVGSGSTITFSLIGPYTPATYTAHGVLLGEGSSSIVATAAGTNGQVLIGSTGADPAFSSITSSGSTLTLTGGAHTLNIDINAPVTVSNGGTGATTLTGVLTGNGTSAITGNAVTQHGVLIGGASNAVSSLGVAATGTVLAGNTGADPSFQTLSGIAVTSITGTANQITASAATGDVTLSIPATFIAPGSIASTTTLTAGTSLSVTTSAVIGTTLTATGGLTTLAALTQVGTTNINASGAAVTTIGTGGTGAVNIGNATGNTAVTGSLTASTTLTATLGDITATNGNVVLGTAGNKIVIATGSNASVGTSGAMSGTPGAVTVATTACSATAKIFYSRNVTGGTPGNVSITAQDGTGFTLTSTGNETSTFNWWIINA